MVAYCNRKLQTSADKERVLSVYGQVLLREPERDDLRRDQPRISLWNWAISTARKTIWKSSSAAVRTTANWRTFWSMSRDARSAGKSGGLLPRRHRSRPGSTSTLILAWRGCGGPLDQPTEADQVMDALVAANDHNAAAYLERAAYRDCQRLARGRGERRRPSRELAPDDARVILTRGRPRCSPRPRRRRSRH